MSVCRICLCSNPSKDITELKSKENNSHSADYVLLFCLGIQINQEAEKSTTFCLKCFTKIVEFHEFKSLAKNNEAILRSLGIKVFLKDKIKSEVASQASDNEYHDPLIDIVEPLDIKHDELHDEPPELREFEGDIDIVEPLEIKHEEIQDEPSEELRDLGSDIDFVEPLDTKHDELHDEPSELREFEGDIDIVEPLEIKHEEIQDEPSEELRDLGSDIDFVEPLDTKHDELHDEHDEPSEELRDLGSDIDFVEPLDTKHDELHDEPTELREFGGDIDIVEPLEIKQDEIQDEPSEELRDLGSDIDFVEPLDTKHDELHDEPPELREFEGDIDIVEPLEIKHEEIQDEPSEELRDLGSDIDFVEPLDTKHDELHDEPPELREFEGDIDIVEPLEIKHEEIQDEPSEELRGMGSEIRSQNNNLFAGPVDKNRKQEQSDRPLSKKRKLDSTKESVPGKNNKKSKWTSKSCDKCGKSFSSPYALKMHAKTHKPIEQRRTVQCAHCNIFCVDKNILLQHLMRKHCTELGFPDKYKTQCDLCQKFFTTVTSMQKHKRMKHMGDKSSCPVCKKDFSLGYLKYHIQMVHEKDSLEFQCDSCSLRFISKARLMRHMTVHTNEKPFGCDRCDSKFRLSYSLVLHKREVHDKTKNHVCHICSMRYFSNTRLQMHIRQHTPNTSKEKQVEPSRVYKKNKVKLVACPDCGKPLANEQSLKKHRFLHTGNKPFTCSICELAFATRNYVQVHMKTHTQEKKFSCRYCPATFVRGTTLRRHELHLHLQTKEEKSQRKYEKRKTRSSTITEQNTIKATPTDIE